MSEFTCAVCGRDCRCDVCGASCTEDCEEDAPGYGHEYTISASKRGATRETAS